MADLVAYRRQRREASTMDMEGKERDVKNRKRSDLGLEGLPNPVHITADNTHPLLDGEEGI